MYTDRGSAEMLMLWKVMTLSWWCLSDSLCLCWFAGQPPRSYPAETSSVPPGRQGPPAAPQVGVYHNRLAYQTLYVSVFDVVKQHDLLSWIHSCFCCLGSCPFLKGSPTSTRGVTSANSWINGRRYSQEFGIQQNEFIFVDKIVLFLEFQVAAML